MAEDRHYLSEPRPVPGLELPTWEVDVMREGVPTPILTLLLDRTTLPPRRNPNKKNIAWKLPDSLDVVPKFGLQDKKRILELFKEKKKELKKQKKKRASVTTTTTANGRVNGGIDYDPEVLDVAPEIGVDSGEILNQEKVLDVVESSSLQKGVTTNASSNNSNGNKTKKNGHRSTPQPPTARLPQLPMISTTATTTTDHPFPQQAQPPPPLTLSIPPGLGALTISDETQEVTGAPQILEPSFTTTTTTDTLSAPPGVGELESADKNNANGKNGRGNHGVHSESTSHETQQQQPQKVSTLHAPPQSMPLAPPPGLAVALNPPPGLENVTPSLPSFPFAGVPPAPPPSAATIAEPLLSGRYVPPHARETHIPQQMPQQQQELPLSPGRCFVIPPECQMGGPNSISKLIAEAYYLLLSRNMVDDLNAYYTPRAFKSLTVGGAHALCGGGSSLSAQQDRKVQLASLTDMTFTIKGVFPQPSVVGSLLVTITGVGVKPSSPSAAALTDPTAAQLPFCHTLLLVPVRTLASTTTTSQGVSDDSATTTTSTPMMYTTGYQIQNDAQCFLTTAASDGSGAAAGSTSSPSRRQQRQHQSGMTPNGIANGTLNGHAK